MSEQSKHEESYDDTDPETRGQETFENETELVSSQGKNETKIKELQIDIDDNEGKRDWMCKSNPF